MAKAFRPRRRPGVVARRNALHARGVQGQGRADLRQGAVLGDPSGLLSSSLAGKSRGAIEIHADDDIDTEALTALIQEAVLLNEASR